MIERLKRLNRLNLLIWLIIAGSVIVGGYAILSAAAADRFASRLEALYFQEDYERGASEGLAWTKTHPMSPKVTAWLVLNEARAGMAVPALSLVNAMKSSQGDHTWDAFAEAGALIFDNRRESEALEASRRAIADHPNLEVTQWLRAETLRVRNRFGEALTYLDSLPNSRASALLLSVRGAILMDRAKRDLYDKRSVNAALDVFRRAATIDPKSVKALFLPGYALMDADRPAEACPYLARAAQMSLSSRVHGMLWDCLNEDPTRTVEERDKLVDADVSYSVEPRHVTAQLLDTAAVMYETRGRPTIALGLRSRLLQDFPASPYSGDELVKRARVLLDAYKGSFVPDSIRSSAITSLRKVGSQPNLRGSRTARNANLLLLKLLGEAPKADPADLLAAASGAVEQADDPGTFAQAARGLAQRGINLSYAQALARNGMRMLPNYAAGIPFPNAALRDDWMRIAQADLHDALGFALLRAGSLPEAQAQLDQAYKLEPTSRDTILHLGELAAATGDQNKAENWFLKCASMAGLERNPCAAALSSLYIKRTGSDTGLDKYLKGLGAKLATFQRAEFTAARNGRGKPITFDETSLNGVRYSSASLKGKVAVINFWGIWCDACRIELPEFARFAKKYKADKSVAFISVNDGRDLVGVRRWLKDTGFIVPVLVNLRIGMQAGVHAVPTTLFLDKMGRPAFRIEGVSGNLEEQFARRIDVLRAEETVR